jgi:hypothetical protein
MDADRRAESNSFGGDETGNARQRKIVRRWTPNINQRDHRLAACSLAELPDRVKNRA